MGDLQNVQERAVLDFAWTLPAFLALHQWSKDEIFEAIDQHRKALESGPGGDQPAYPDLRTPEWEVFSAAVPPEPTDDFTLRRPDGVPPALAGFLSDVVQAERLREVRALTGFTRLDAPDPEDPDLVTRAPLARDRPTWVPASEVRGEGIFLRIDPAWWPRGRTVSATRTWSASTWRRSGGSGRTATPTGSGPTSTRCTAGPGRGTSRCTPCPTC